MTCNKSTMLKLALGMAAIFLVTYAALPGFRTWLLSIAPLLLPLLCPLSMLFCMKGMSKKPQEPAAGPAEPNALAAIPSVATANIASSQAPQPVNQNMPTGIGCGHSAPTRR
ncbi:MAG: DUF2933 domain-containing protein [Pseudogulbenkiania sp.]|nr:DUF2933 domain-containing protein [Pseudogulbenkiania sp.]